MCVDKCEWLWKCMYTYMYEHCVNLQLYFLSFTQRKDLHLVNKSQILSVNTIIHLFLHGLG